MKQTVNLINNLQGNIEAYLYDEKCLTMAINEEKPIEYISSFEQKLHTNVRIASKVFRITAISYIDLINIYSEKGKLGLLNRWAITLSANFHII